MIENKPKTYTQTKKLISDWTDKKYYLIQYRKLKFYIRYGMILDKVCEKISIRQSKCLEKCKNFNTQRRNYVDNDFEKDFYKLLNNAFYGKTMEIILNQIRVDIIRKDDKDEKSIKQQSELTFNGIHEYDTNYDSYTLKQNEVLMDKSVYLGFAMLELSKLLMRETYYDKLQPYFGLENLQLRYIDCGGFILSFRTQNVINDSKNLEFLFDFNNLDENHEIFSKKIEKLLVNLKRLKKFG